MRYFLELSYNGAAYYGWQRQPSQVSVQEVLEHCVGTMLRHPDLEITGCGRTDTGVHASQYFAHFDCDGVIPDNFLSRINKFLPADIAVHRIFPVAATQHARFDACYRAYEYHVTAQKDPFRQHTVLHLPYMKELDRTKMDEAAALLLAFDSFAPFCKTGSDAKTMHCQLYRSAWEYKDQEWVYHIAANRFLRGMVRLIVGMCLSVGSGKLTLAQVRQALEEQSPLPKSLSIAPDGLYLSEVKYEGIELV
ncbi:MAG: tRNA pseudouridine(38-40) synthase TruA [Saprospiraceae bacterium]